MQIEGIEIPDEWCAILSDIRKHDPLAMIAGGSLRDLSLGRAPKDLDIFTTFVPERNDLAETGMDYDGMQYVKAVVTYPVDLDMPFNLVLHEPCTNEAMLESFDFGICQIGFGGTNLIKTKAFEWDVKYGVFTMRHTDRYARSIKRYSRWLNRYDWEIRIPQLDKEHLTV